MTALRIFTAACLLALIIGREIEHAALDAALAFRPDESGFEIIARHNTVLMARAAYIGMSIAVYAKLGLLVAAFWSVVR